MKVARIDDESRERRLNDGQVSIMADLSESGQAGALSQNELIAAVAGIIDRYDADFDSSYEVGQQIVALIREEFLFAQ